MSNFPAFPKITRLFEQDVCITEKIDGTNGLICIERDIDHNDMMDSGRLIIRAGSRNRWLDTTKEGDNHGFAKWVFANAEELFKLGEGYHYGEWWGQGIQHGYGMKQKVFSLFNTHRWADPEVRPACCDVVPVLYQGPLNEEALRIAANPTSYMNASSVAAQKYGVDCRKVEGTMVYFTKAGVYMKSPMEKGAKG